MSTIDPIREKALKNAPPNPMKLTDEQLRAVCNARADDIEGMILRFTSIEVELASKQLEQPKE